MGSTSSKSKRNLPPGINLVKTKITGKNVTLAINNPASDSTLNGLKTLLNPVDSASHNSYEAGQRSQCFPNTRVRVLSDIEAWFKGESHQAPIYILDGVAGIGKSTIAQTIAVKASALGLLGASFFFSRDEDSRKMARHFFPTIAFQLSRYNKTFATDLGQILDQNPDATAMGIPQQLSLLLQEPLQRTLSQEASPVLIVIDALDECEEEDAVQLLALFGQCIEQMKGLKILITSRPEAHLRFVLDQDRNHEKFCLHEIEDAIVHSDIRLFLRFRLSVEEIRKVPQYRDTTWQPTDEDMDMLCGICGTLFIIAATATKFILGSNFTPQKQFSRFIDGVSTPDFAGSKHNKALDRTYIRILCAALPGDDELDREWFENLNRVLGALITLANPLPCPALGLLLEMNPDDIKATLSQLYSLVAPTGNGADITFRIHHKSFPDFVTNKERIQQALTTWKSSIYPGLDSLLWVDVTDQHIQLAKACFRIMDRRLKWNMADIDEEALYKDKEDISHVRPELISGELAYAAMHWASHLRSGQGLNTDSELRMYLDGWASRHILSWMETMVILDQVNGIYGILRDAIKSLPAAEKSWAEHRTVYELLSDACRFVQQGSEVMKISPAHIYRSCLPFVPFETSLYKVYNTMATGRGMMLNVRIGRSDWWDPLFVTLIGHSTWVSSVAFSDDGSRLASGSGDKTVRIWDANTGVHLSTLTGHSSDVNSVAFSRDGSKLASGSSDKNIRLWDPNTGAHLSTLTGHSGAVSSVAFSGDGSRLASGSDDKTIRLWHSNTGVHLSTLTGHSYSVRAVAFSGDGSRLASGSYDKTIRLWDTNTGAHLSTLIGHSSNVSSVAFSGDDSRLASGSYDRTIRLWDANTGAHLSTLTGHSSDVNSVSFSSDSSRLASGSDDRTVRLWDPNTGANLSTLIGHSDFVRAVAFSVDGSRLASGSNDKTLRLWDPNTGAVLPTLTGHSDYITSVAFSSDGSRLASGSGDRTVRIWDANTGGHLSTLTGHSSVVSSVAFSGDDSRLASGSYDKTIRLWDLKTGAHLSTLTGHSYHVRAVAFSSDGSRLASGSGDRTVRLWDANTGAHISTLTGHSRAVSSVAFSSDGSRLASGSDDKTIRLWDPNTGVHLSILVGHSDYVRAVAFSEDGSRLASGSDDGTVQLYANITFTDLVRATFSVVDPRLAFGSGDRTVRTNTCAHLSTLTGYSYVPSVASSSDGSRVASGSNDNTVQLRAHFPTLNISPSSILNFALLNSSQMMGQVASPEPQPLRCRLTDPTSLLLLVKRGKPPITGILMANLYTEESVTNRWEVVPVCWFPPDIWAVCFSVDQLKPQIGIGCSDGRVISLSHSQLIPHIYS